jgi:hypothetical protein
MSLMQGSWHKQPSSGSSPPLATTIGPTSWRRPETRAASKTAAQEPGKRLRFTLIAFVAASHADDAQNTSK